MPNIKKKRGPKPKPAYISFFMRKLPRVVHTEFKAACAAMDETMTQVIKRLMKRYTAEVEGRREPKSSLLRNGSKTTTVPALRDLS